LAGGRGSAAQLPVARGPPMRYVWTGCARRNAGFSIHFKRLRMSNGFKDREKAFEEKWAHDEDLRFKVIARRDKLLGLWAAGEMGLTGGEAEAYAKTVIDADLAEAGDEDVFRKLRADFDAKKIARSDHLIRSKMTELLSVAKDQVMHEVK